MPSGASIRPSIPERKNSGTKLATMISVEFKMGIRTSFEASKTTDITVLRSASGLFLFSRSRLNTFSTSTIASSTSEPMAIAIPPKLIVLIVSPIHLRASIEVTNASGIVTNDITVVRTFIKKIKSTITTKIPPSYNDFCTLSIEFSINLDCR